MAIARLMVAWTLVAWQCRLTSGAIQLDKTYQLLGGQQLLTNLPMMQIDTTGDYFEPQESGVDFLDVNSLTYTVTKTTNHWSSLVRLDMQLRVFFPFHVTNGWANTVINATAGYREGVYNYFGQPDLQPIQEALESSYIMAVLKTELMANPMALLQMNLQGKGQVTDQFVQIQLLANRPDCPSINLWIDPNTNLPTMAQTMEGDWVNGDVVFQVEYGSWTSFGSSSSGGIFQFPQTLTYRLHGDIIRRETVNSIQFVHNVDSNLFVLKTSKVYDADYAIRGYKNAQWFNRGFALGEPFDFKISDGSIQQLTTVGDTNLYQVDCTDCGYFSVVYDTPQGLYLVDAGLTADRSAVVLNILAQKWPNKRVLGLIVSHMHYDHVGGLRGMAAGVDKVYVGLPSAQYVKTILYSLKPTILPDAFTQSGRQDVEVVPVPDRLHLGVEPNSFDVIRLKNVGHSIDYLAVYFPTGKMIVVADLLNGGQINVAALAPPPSRRELYTRAKQLMAEIAAANIDVQTVFTIHGGAIGTVPISELQRMAGNNYEHLYT